MKQVRILLATLLMIAASAAPPARAGLVLDLANVGLTAFCNNCGSTGTTLGYAFTLTLPVTIDGLGLWDSAAPGLGTSVRTGLWNASGSLIAEAVIGDASTVVASANPNGRWLFEDIAATTLGPGSYRIGSLHSDDSPLAQIAATLTTIPGFTFDGGRSAALDAGFADPTNDQGLFLIGPTLRTAAVPEPEGVALVALTLLALATQARRRRR